MKRRHSDFSTQDQDNEVICISETQWSGKHDKNVGQKALGYFGLPWCSAKSNRVGQRKEAAVCLKDVSACSEDQGRRALFVPVCWPVGSMSSRM